MTDLSARKKSAYSCTGPPNLDSSSQNCTDPVTVSMVGEGVVFQGMRGYTVPPHAPAVACFTMSVTQHILAQEKVLQGSHL